jgi:hypothetical protein
MENIQMTEKKDSKLTETQAFNNIVIAIEMAQKKGSYTLAESSALFESILKVKEKMSLN